MGGERGGDGQVSLHQDGVGEIFWDADADVDFAEAGGMRVYKSHRNAEEAGVRFGKGRREDEQQSEDQHAKEKTRLQPTRARESRVCCKGLESVGYKGTCPQCLRPVG